MTSSFKSRLMGGFVAAVLVLGGLGSSSAASIISTSVAIPDSEVIINFNGTGLDWVYAGPIAPDEFGTGQIEHASYRASEGWRVANAVEWALRPDWEDFTRPGFSTPSFGNDHTSYRYASEYWSTFSHVDLSDASAGRLTNGATQFGDPPLIGSLDNVYETWYVRDTQNVPDSGSTTVMLGAALVLLAAVAGRIS